MFSNKHSFTANKEMNVLILLVLFSIFIRVPIVSMLGDEHLQYEWKILVGNLIEHKQLAWKNCEFAYWTTKSCLDDNFLLPNLSANFLLFSSFLLPIEFNSIFFEDLIFKKASSKFSG